MLKRMTDENIVNYYEFSEETSLIITYENAFEDFGQILNSGI